MGRWNVIREDYLYIHIGKTRVFFFITLIMVSRMKFYDWIGLYRVPLHKQRMKDFSQRKGLAWVVLRTEIRNNSCLLVSIYYVNRNGLCYNSDIFIYLNSEDISLRGNLYKIRIISLKSPYKTEGSFLPLTFHNYLATESWSSHLLSIYKICPFPSVSIAIALLYTLILLSRDYYISLSWFPCSSPKLYIWNNLTMLCNSSLPILPQDSAKEHLGSLVSYAFCGDTARRLALRWQPKCYNASFRIIGISYFFL